MARIKQPVIQRDFTYGEVREDFLEADDIDVRGKSLRRAKNLRVLASRGIEQRPGTRFSAFVTAKQVHEVRIAGTVLRLILWDAAVRLYDVAGALVFADTTVGWTSGNSLWIVPLDDTIYIGDPATGLYGLIYYALTDTWRLADITFQGGLTAPFWKYAQGITITPSARTGTITVTASDDAFVAAHVGSYIRYGEQHILIATYISPTQVTGIVEKTLPPSWTIEVASTAEFAVGEALVGQDSGFIGVVAEITSATLMKVLTTDNFDGPDASEKLSGPRGTQDVVAKTLISPVASQIWDEQLVSDARGWPGAGAAASGRLVLMDFPQLPHGIALSSLRRPDDFTAGAEDDDAIVRTIGRDGARMRHAVDLGDMMILSEGGSYIISLRDGNPLTPATFNPILVDNRGCNGVRPAVLADGLVFVGLNNTTIFAALLDGNIYLKWSVRPISIYHTQQNRTPVQLSGPPRGFAGPEQYLFIVNADGTAAAMSWDQSFKEQAVGFIRWETQGAFKWIAPVFSTYWMLIERVIGGVTLRCLEYLDFGAYLDCAVDADPNGTGAAHLNGSTATVYWMGRQVGTGLVTGGAVANMTDVTSAAQIGFGFEVEAAPWPVELLNSPRLGMVTVRAFTFTVSVQQSGPFDVICNAQRRSVGGWTFGDDLTEPQASVTKVYRVPVTGRRDHNDMSVIRTEAGPFRVLALGQEVQG